MKVGGKGTFVDKENQTQISELGDHIFNIFREPFRARCPPRDTNKDLTEKATKDELIEDSVGHIEDEEERRLDENRHDSRLVIGQERVYLGRHLVLASLQSRPRRSMHWGERRLWWKFVVVIAEHEANGLRDTQGG
jgi:hypothetical protein